MAEVMRRHSTYNYAFNNPVRFIDPDGMAPIQGAANLIAQARAADEEEEKEKKKKESLYISPMDDPFGGSFNLDRVAFSSLKANVRSREKDEGDKSANQAMEVRYLRGAVGGPIPWYGNFLGPGPKDNPFNLRGYDGRILRPIDMLDAAAQRHDYAYFLANTGGVRGALFNKSVADADIALSVTAQWVIIYSALGIKDPVSGRPVSSSELKWAWGIFGSFTELGALKKF